MLKGEKVTLREVRDSDYDRLTEFNNNFEIWVMADDDPPAPRTRKQVQTEIEEWIKDGTAIPFVVEADGEVIGDCGLHHLAEHSRTCSFGIALHGDEYLGKGYGREAVSLLLDFAFRLRNMRRVWLTVNADNERAIRSYKALGFTEEGRLREHVWQDGAYHDWVYMGLMRTEWEAR
jgi:RimJ/RimL family protein N-acetyltransferase